MGIFSKDFSIRSQIMELLGVLTIVFFGGLCSMIKDANKGSIVSQSLATLLIIIFMTYVGTPISGAHYNPVVTLTQLITKNHRLWPSLFYWVAQFAGSFAGAGLLYLYSDGNLRKLANQNDNYLGVPSRRNHINSDQFFYNWWYKAYFCEFIGTFMVVWAFFACCVDKKRAPKHVYAICIGGSYSAAMLAFDNISGACLNPARWLGPAIIYIKNSNNLIDFWIYQTAPFAGGILAGIQYIFVMMDKDENQTNDQDIETF